MNQNFKLTAMFCIFLVFFNCKDGKHFSTTESEFQSSLNALFKDFCSCFNDADIVAIADVYSAGEEKIPGASRDDLVSGLLRHGHRHAISVSNLEELSQIVTANAKPGDVVICLGAGSISSWASALLKLLHGGF